MDTVDEIKVAYISGPMSGIDDLPVKVRQASQVQAYLTIMGYYTYNPYASCMHPACWDVPKVLWMENDLFWIEGCDTIVMLPGWENQLGCLEEIELAQRLNLTILLWDADMEEAYPISEGDA